MSERFFFEVFEVLPDFITPTIAFTAPEETVIGISMPEISLAYADEGRGLDLGTLIIKLDAQDITGTCTVGPSTTTCPTPELEEGRHIMIAQIRDLAGNRGWGQRYVALSLDLAVAVTAPGPGFVTREGEVTVEGTVAAQAESVTVGGIQAALSSGTFVAEGVALREGVNLLTVVARNAGGGIGAAPIRIVRDTVAPQAIIRTPPGGFATAASEIMVAGDVFDAGSADGVAEAPRVVVNGLEVPVERGSFLHLVPLLPGPNLLTVTVTDAAGNTRTVQRTIEKLQTTALVVEDIAGNGQSAGVGDSLAEPLMVRLVDRHGLPVATRRIRFEVTRGNGRLGPAEQASRVIHVATDPNGLAAVPFTLGDRAGMGNHEVTASVTGVRSSVIFCASATQGPATRIVPVAGSNALGALTAATGTEAPFPFLVQVFDANGNPTPGVDTIFEVVAGGGSFAEGTTQTVTTDAEGMAAARFVLGPRPGTNINILRARFEGLAELPANLIVTGINPGPEAATSVAGLVLDNTEAPIEGVTARILGTSLTAQTDAAGRFEIPGAPVGMIRLEIDGTTAARPGTWPIIDYDFATISGHSNDLGKPIRLLPLDTGTAQTVGGTDDVTLTVTGLAGTGITIFAGSATFPDGSREGEVTITQVPSNKVPMVAPRGGNFTLAITLQPPGILFDPPARITLPNTEGLDPGSELELFRFDHDLGEFVTAGVARVTDDGRFVESPPGGGIVKSGWQAVADPQPPGNVCVDGPCTVCSPTGPAPRFEVSDVQIVIGASEIPIEDGDVAMATLGQPQIFRAIVDATCSTSALWEFGDGETQAGSVVQHTYASSGLYEVDLAVSCTMSCGDTFGVDAARTFVPQSIRPVALTFSSETGLNDVLQDNNSEPYGTPHWVDRDLLDDEPATTPSDHNFPVTYPRGSPMQIEAVFEINPAPPAALAAGFVIEGEGPEGILMEGASIGVAGTEVTFTTDSGNTKLPDHIDKLSLPIVWRLTGDGGLSWHNAGRTQSRIYVTLDEPLEGFALHETVLDIGTREASGAT